MPSVFISYSHSPEDPRHGERVAGVAASLMRDGLTVFFDQNRGDEEEKVPWPIWMEDKIDVADHVLLVCTEHYYNKVRQRSGERTGFGVCWEANLIYNQLYIARLNTTKFVPVLFSDADSEFIPGPLRGAQRFVLNSDAEYGHLYAFLTGQHRLQFPGQGSMVVPIAQTRVEPLFALPNTARHQPAGPVAAAEQVAPRQVNTGHALRPDEPPAPRREIRGLDWYDECDSACFLGRDEPVSRLLAMMLSNPVVRLVGPSGIGKSSLIRAGLLPKIREFGWRACVVRPFENPAERIPAQLSASLLCHGTAFSTPLDAAKFRSEISRLLSANGIGRLILLLDQLEDIVSPLAAPGALQTVRLLMQEFWENREQKPFLRALLVSRTEADVVLARLWQEISGRSEGIPYMPLQGLDLQTVRTIVADMAKQNRWNPGQGIEEIVQQLAQESRFLNYPGEVFPVYVQIILKQLNDRDEQLPADSISSRPPAVSGLIGRYLEKALARLEARGGDWRHCGAILEALSRASGVKGTQSFEELTRETGVSRPVLVEILAALVAERLVRPTGYEMYEIQHDRLAAAVIERMGDRDREAKAAREFLSAKAIAFDWTASPLSHEELAYLYRHRNRIHPNTREQRVLFLSLIAPAIRRFPRAVRGVPGWYWLRNVRVEDVAGWFGEWRIKLGHPREAGMPWRLDASVIRGELEDLAKHSKDPAVRQEAVIALAAASLPELRLLFRELAGKKEDAAVRRQAVKSLAACFQPEDVPLLREMAKDADWTVRQSVLAGLAKLSRPEDIPLFVELAKDGNEDVHREAVKALARFGRPEDRALFRELVKSEDEDDDVRESAAKALAGIAQSEGVSLLIELTKDESFYVRRSAAAALASLARTEDLQLFQKLVKDEDEDVRREAVKALAGYPQSEILPMLRELIKDDDDDVRQEAVKVLAGIAQAEDLDIFAEMAKNEDWSVRASVAAGLARLARPGDLPFFRDMAKDSDDDVRNEAVKALAALAQPEDIPLFRELARDENEGVRAEAVKALLKLPPSEAFPVLRDCVRGEGQGLPLEAVGALGSLASPEAVALLRELAESENPGLRLTAIESLTELCVSRADGRLTAHDATCIWSIEQSEAFIDEDHEDVYKLARLDTLLYRPKWIQDAYPADD